MTKDRIAAILETAGFAPRQADLRVIEAMGGTKEVLTEYLWDHLMGEPESPTVEEVGEMVQFLADPLDRIWHLTRKVAEGGTYDEGMMMLREATQIQATEVDGTNPTHARSARSAICHMIESVEILANEEGR